MVFGSVHKLEKQYFYWAVCLAFLHVLYFAGNYVIIKTSPAENNDSIGKDLKIAESNETNNEIDKPTGVVNPLQWLDISASSKEGGSSQGGQCVDPGRYWTYSETMMEGSSKLKTFKLLSYNVLSQSLLEEHPYLYRYNHPNALNWNFRSQLLFAEIKSLDADILCLQEVENDHIYLFENQLRLLGYQGIYKKRSHKRVDGVAIFFKSQTFILQEYTSVEFYQPNVDVLNRDNVALVAKFALRSSPSDRVVVATTHLLFNMNRHDVKLAQTQLLLAEVERYAYAGIGTNGPQYLPVVITGDMNFKPLSGVYNFLTQGRLRFKGLLKKNLTESLNGNGSVFRNVLLPRWLQITDSCQHLGILPLREYGDVSYRSQEVKHLRIQNTDFKHQKLQWSQGHWASRVEQYAENVEPSKLLRSLMPQPGNSQSVGLDDNGGKMELVDEKDELTSGRFESGELTHPFKLLSAYTDHKHEVTTYHNSWVTVDHIFYSVPKDEFGNGLKLLATYKLPTYIEADRVGRIPSFTSPSDHYPLLVLFGLGNELQKM